MIFVDSSAWFASVVPSEIDDPAVTRWMRQNAEPLLTTDYVVDETLTLLRSRRQPQLALTLGDQFFRGEIAQIDFLDEGEIRLAWEVFRRYSDKEWSFTDCTSKVVIEKLQIATAFAFDHHFHQFGTVQVVP
jgi:predicted nucleic acid-binding protein